MPFTFSHPAAVLPLALLQHRWVSVSGLVAGSMAPDFEYFLRMELHSSFSHTLHGLLWFNLPMGIILAFVFHNLVRNRLFENLPLALKARMAPFQSFNWNTHFIKNWPVVAISVLLGAASHIAWDSFTHADGYFAATVPLFSRQVHMLGFTFPVVKLAQHGSTLIGGLVVLLAIWRLPASSEVEPAVDLKYWFLAATVCMGVILARLAFSDPELALGHLIASGMAGMMIGLLVSPSRSRQRHQG